MEQEYLPKAEKLFVDLGVKITSAGRRYQGGAIDCPDFVRGYLEGLIFFQMSPAEKRIEFESRSGLDRLLLRIQQKIPCTGTSCGRAARARS